MIKFNLIVSLLILPIMATDIAAQARFTPKELPYAYDALAPQVSEETLRFHHDKHYVGYVNKLNELILDTPYARQPLEDIVVSADGAIFNNAAQMWNHEFFFDQLSPDGEARPTGALLKAIDADFGSFEQFKAQMEKAAVGLFGSGWAWLAEDKSGKLAIVTEQNAGNPMCHGMKPLCASTYGARLLHRLPQPSCRRRRRPLGSYRLEGRRRSLRKEIRVCFCWKCRLRFSGRHFSFVLQANPPRPAFRSRPGEGGIYRAGLVALQPGVSPKYPADPAMSIFVLKIHHYVRFFVHGFRFLRERVYLRCTKIVRLKCWRGFNMLCSSCFLSWQEVWTALRFSPVGRFRSRPDSPVQSPDAGSGTQLFHGGSLHLRRFDRKSRPTLRPEGDRPPAP